MDQPPIQPDRTIGAGAAPAGAGAAQAQLAPLHTQRRGKMVEPFNKHSLGLAHQPGLYRVFDLVRRSRLRQADMQRKTCDAG